MAGLRAGDGYSTVLMALMIGVGCFKRCTRLRAPRDQRYSRVYLFGVACPARGATAALVLPEANAAMMNLRLDTIAKQVAEGAHAAALLDGAGHDRSTRLKVPCNIALIRLPAYAPELNSAENI